MSALNFGRPPNIHIVTFLISRNVMSISVDHKDVKYSKTQTHQTQTHLVSRTSTFKNLAVSDVDKTFPTPIG